MTISDIGADLKAGAFRLFGALALVVAGLATMSVASATKAAAQDFRWDNERVETYREVRGESVRTANLDDRQYRRLTRYGRWIDHPIWGEAWKPDVGTKWKPFTRGQWVHDRDEGLVWESDEEFGSFVYHYGRWDFEERRGWLWVPGERYSPAWVMWREGDGVTGWAPLPPDKRRWGDSSPRDDNGGPFDLALPQIWSFVDTADLERPRVHRFLIPRGRNARLLQRSEPVFARAIGRSLGVVVGSRRGYGPGRGPSYVERFETYHRDWRVGPSRGYFDDFEIIIGDDPRDFWHERPGPISRSVRGREPDRDRATGRQRARSGNKPERLGERGQPRRNEHSRRRDAVEAKQQPPGATRRQRRQRGEAQETARRSGRNQPGGAGQRGEPLPSKATVGEARKRQPRFDHLQRRVTGQEPKQDAGAAARAEERARKQQRQGEKAARAQQARAAKQAAKEERKRAAKAKRAAEQEAAKAARREAKKKARQQAKAAEQAAAKKRRDERLEAQRAKAAQQKAAKAKAAKEAKRKAREERQRAKAAERAAAQKERAAERLAAAKRKAEARAHAATLRAQAAKAAAEEKARAKAERQAARQARRAEAAN